MRLLTHNLLHCPRTKAYPLTLEIETCDEIPVPYSAQFLIRLLPRINYPVFLAAASQLPDPELLALLPRTPPSSEDDPALRALHRALLQYHVVDGALVAEGARYRVSNGVPNLVITEVRAEHAPPAEMDVGHDSVEEGPAPGPASQTAV